MTKARTFMPKSMSLSVALVWLVCVPTMAMDVKLTFQLPRGMGLVEAGFIGFDNDRDGVIDSSANEIVSAWSSITGPWSNTFTTFASISSPGTVDIRYTYAPEPQDIGNRYSGDDFAGLRRFVIETKSPSGNHVNSNGLIFRGESRFGFLSAYGLGWSDTYNAPSSYTYTFEGPENSVRLSLFASGSPFATAVPEPNTLWYGLAGLFLVLIFRDRLLSSRFQRAKLSNT
jgi:hypothetical protein